MSLPDDLTIFDVNDYQGEPPPHVEYADPKTWQARGSGLAGPWAVAILLGALALLVWAGGAW